MTERELRAWLDRLSRIPNERKTESESRQWWMLRQWARSAMVNEQPPATPTT